MQNEKRSWQYAGASLSCQQSEPNTSVISQQVLKTKLVQQLFMKIPLLRLSKIDLDYYHEGVGIDKWSGTRDRALKL